MIYPNFTPNIVLSNQTIGVTISLNYAIVLGETVTINVLTQTVTNNFNDNLMSYLEGDLASFGLSPPPQAPNGINSIYIGFSAATSGVSAAVLEWRNKYIGI